MLSMFRRLLQAGRFSWVPAVEWTDPRVRAALRTFDWS